VSTARSAQLRPKLLKQPQERENLVLHIFVQGIELRLKLIANRDHPRHFSNYGIESICNARAGCSEWQESRQLAGPGRLQTGYALLHDPAWVSGENMLDQVVKDEWLREQMLAGPMGPHLDVLASRLLQIGYSRTQSRKIVRTASLLGDWLAERGLTPADAGKPELQEYMAGHKRTPKGRLSDGAVGFSRLPALLAAQGVLCKPDAPAPSDSCLHRFQQYLIDVRGTTPRTDAHYRRILRPFVAGLCSSDEPDWSKLTAEYVTDFVVRQAAAVRAERQPCVQRRAESSRRFACSCTS
jgi:hypothetical protein